MPSARRSFDLCDVNIHVARYGTNGSTRVVFNTYRNRSVQQLAKAIIVDCYAWFMTPYSSRKHRPKHCRRIDRHAAVFDEVWRWQFSRFGHRRVYLVHSTSRTLAGAVTSRMCLCAHRVQPTDTLSGMDPLTQSLMPSAVLVLRHWSTDLPNACRTVT